MKEIIILFFLFSGFYTSAQNAIPPNANFLLESVRPCHFDSTVMILQADDWLIYQTLDDTWNGVMDSTQCIGVKDTLEKLIIELDGLDISKPLFVKSLMDDSNKILLQPDRIYQGSATMELAENTFANFSPNCANGFCTGVILGIEIPDSTGLSTDLRTYVDAAEFGTDEFFDFCLVTEKFPENYLKEVIYKVKVLGNSGENLWFRPQSSSLYPFDDYFISLINQDTLVPDFSYNPSDSSYYTFLSEISAPSNYFGNNYILIYHDSTYPSPNYLSFLDLTPEVNVSYQRTINVVVDFHETVHPQPFVQFRGGLVEGSDSIRHHFNLVNDGGDLCFADGWIEFTFNDGNNYIHQGGDILFGEQTSCLQFRNNSALIVADDTYFEYGKSGMGMLALRTGGTIQLGKNSTLQINNTMALMEETELWGVVEDQQIFMELNKGSKLIFGEKARLHNKYSIDEKMKLNIYMNGGILDDSNLSSKERAIINLIYPDPPQLFSENVEAFPNPASDFLNFSMILKNEDNVEFEAYDVAGRFVFSKNENGKKGVNDFQIDVRDLSKGIYFFRIKSELGEVTKKITIF